MIKIKIISLLDDCNMACSYCASGCSSKQPYNISDKKLFFSKEHYLEIINNFSGGIIIFTGGEPTLHPHFKEFMDLALFQNNKVAVYTNGINQKILKEFINLDDVLFILGAHTRYRSIGKFQKIRDFFNKKNTLINIINEKDTDNKDYVGSYNYIENDNIKEVLGDDVEFNWVTDDLITYDNAENTEFITPDGMVYGGMCDKPFTHTLSNVSKDALDRIQDEDMIPIGKMLKENLRIIGCWKKCQTILVNNLVIKLLT